MGVMLNHFLPPNLQQHLYINQQGGTTTTAVQKSPYKNLKKSIIDNL